MASRVCRQSARTDDAPHTQKLIDAGISMTSLKIQYFCWITVRKKHCRPSAPRPISNCYAMSPSPIDGDIYAVERDITGRQDGIMKSELNDVAV